MNSPYGWWPQFAAHFLDEAGVDLGELEDAYDLVSPNDLARLLQGYSGCGPYRPSIPHG